MSSSQKRRLDQELVERGLAPSRTKAQDLVRAGAILVNGAVVSVPSTPVAASDRVVVTDSDSVLLYVSRAGYKLAGALDRTRLEISGFNVLDLGSSTGGFADCLLKRGAARVVGVDVGHGQLDGGLAERAARRLVNIEGLNVKDLETSELFAAHRDESFDLVTADLSFIPLSAVLPVIVRRLQPGSRLLALVKPQFELGPEALDKKGVVKGDGHYRELKVRILRQCEDLGLRAIDYFESSLAGKDGNREFFIYAQK